MKTYSESYMGQWWRKAVLRHWGYQCAVCGACEASGSLECHHIVKRSKLLTRWDWKNGVPLCVKCHRRLHDGHMGTQQEVMLQAPHEYLDYYNGYTSAQYFTEAGITKAEWYKIRLDENKAKAEGGV